MKQIVESAEVLTSEGEVLNLTNEELGMGYRTSVIAKNDYVALSAVLKLEKGDRQEIRAYMEDLKERRVTKQPLEFGSAGSTFKRPEGYFAGKLIQDSGMQGYRSETLKCLKNTADLLSTEEMLRQRKSCS